MADLRLPATLMEALAPELLQATPQELAQPLSARWLGRMAVQQLLAEVGQVASAPPRRPQRQQRKRPHSRR